MHATRWGILGPGKIARSFAHDLALAPGAELAAVGSRSGARARAFAQDYGAEAAYGSYEELLADSSIDVVYIASPHALHLEHARLALESGRHVLCEKPLTLSVAEAEEMIALARQHDRFLMEAMWTACHPVVLALRDRLRTGELGTPHHLLAELGFVVDAPPEDRMLDPSLGAGALLDMGIYPLTFAHLLLGEAEELTAYAVLSEEGIDMDIAIMGRYPGGALATMKASMSWTTSTTLTMRRSTRWCRAARTTACAAQLRAGSTAPRQSSASAMPTRSSRWAAVWPRGCARARWCRTSRP
jgi:predicted dehydrogenase